MTTIFKPIFETIDWLSAELFCDHLIEAGYRAFVSDEFPKRRRLLTGGGQRYRVMVSHEHWDDAVRTALRLIDVAGDPMKLSVA